MIVVLFILLYSFKMNIIVLYIANVTPRTFEIVNFFPRLSEYNYLIISIIKNFESTSTERVRESRDFHVRGSV